MLDHAYDAVDYISVHAYYEEKDGDLASFLASSVDMDRVHPRRRRHRRPRRRQASQPQAGRPVLRRVERLVPARLRRPHEASTSSRRPASSRTPSPSRTPSSSAASSTPSCATPTGSRSPARPSSSTSSGCIRTEEGGPAWRQTIFHPFAQTARLARGTALRVEPRGADARDRAPRRGRHRRRRRDLGRGERRRRACSSSTGIRPTPVDVTVDAARLPGAAGGRVPPPRRRRPPAHEHAATTPRPCSPGPTSPLRVEGGCLDAAAEPRVLDRRRPHRPPSLTARHHRCRAPTRHDHHRAHPALALEGVPDMSDPSATHRDLSRRLFLGSFGAVGASAALAACSRLEHASRGGPVQRRLRQGRHVHRPQGRPRLLERLHRW